ncbi:hypothetical protein M409DRAFT_26523 [Zasmidium cellare ATCC 36951]|uniref:N-acetyltransferase domain-containing protein n=1 Tax=Zasmidium cellare ATCC 36951 TaxID=1080233 RepID=A0A6A6C7B8_ZASCE|nr:uncharacterized protein M409DRAFT_26523 [Zasmidium cellare ATCC 36951]KAF2163077.1 hypothetical protein M409DRAFT_26523 [Zasmidium cellare ATCC 36951]
MAIEAVTNVTKVQDGPMIDDKPSTIVTLTAQQLRTSKFLPSLVNTINQAYKAAEGQHLGESKGDRLGSIDELILVLRDDPESFIIVLTQPHAPEEVLSTATSRRYFGPSPDANTSPWACVHTPAADTEEWELKLLATSPAAQGKGIASYMLALAEKEATERFRAKSGQGEGAITHAKMILCTPKPLYGKFYGGRGYREDYIKIREKPDMSYEITFMSKVLASR